MQVPLENLAQKESRFASRFETRSDKAHFGKVGVFEERSWCRLRDSNTRPHHYEYNALVISNLKIKEKYVLFV